MTDFSSLLSRVEAARDADRELDMRILCALMAPAGSYVDRSKYNGAWCIYDASHRLWEKRSWWHQDDWPLTSSTDAALRLVERMLPWWDITMRRGLRGEYAMAEICQRTGAFRDETLGFCERADNELPLAIIAALLQALERKTHV